jgi:hypothetical protein
VFPDALSAYYLECRLTDQTTQVDLLACTDATRGGREVLAGLNGHSGLPEFVRGSPYWQRVDAFLQDWSDPTTALHRDVPLVWLEFDILGPPPEIPIPSLHVCLAQEWARAGERTVVPADGCREIAASAFELALGRPLAHAVNDTLYRCFNALPEGGRIIHFSTMMARDPVTFKVYSELAKDQVVPYLARIDWSGDLQEMTRLLETYCQDLDVLRVELNIEEDVLAKTGIEFLDSMQMDHDPERHHLLAQCMTHGLCAREKYEALLSWPGIDAVTFEGHSWPTKVRRWLDVKLVYQANASLEAKGYLGFMPYFSLF